MDQPIKPNNITKPIQLLAAWLAGLLAIDSCFLIAAGRLPVGSWEAQALTIASIANVPLFLLAVFLLQTRFRPELQEDLYYSTYISQKTNSKVQILKEDTAIVAMTKQLEKIELRAQVASEKAQFTAEHVDLSSLRFGINQNLQDRDAIAKVFAKAGMVSYTLFGSDELPKYRVAAVQLNLDPQLERAVLRLATEAGFNKFSYIENFERIPEHVLLGSYGDETLELAPPP